MRLAFKTAATVTVAVSAAVLLEGHLLRNPAGPVETSVFLSIVAALIFAGVYFIVGRRLGSLAKAADRVSTGHYSQKIGIKGNDELSSLAREIDLMAKQLETANERAEHETAARLATLEQLRHVDRLKTVGQLTSGVVHEIGTPLTVILGRARMIQRGEATGEEARDCARVAVEQTEKVTKSVRGILDFARRESSRERPPNDLSEMAENMTKLLSPVAVRSGIYMSFEKNDTPTIARVDLSQVQQALANLMMNAIQATKSGGRVVVGVSRREMNHPKRPGDEAAPYLDLVVRDEGEGIPEDALDLIFEPFFTTKASGQGTGLGLAISKEIIRDHGGWISVESEQGKGSCFTIHLPAQKE